jgi:methionine-rich copper-binding protein CopC
MGLALLVAGVLALGETGSASAHANLASSEPAQNARVAQPPAELVLRFTQDLERSGSWVQLRDNGGSNLVRSFEFDDANRRLMRAQVADLAPGVYRGVWQALSAEDGDYADSSYEFVVLNPDGSTPGEAEGGGVSPSQDGSDGGLDVSTALVAVVAIVLVGGALVFALRFERTA